MRLYFDQIYGNQTLTEQLGEQLRQNKLFHALIIEGAPGSGKRLLARQLAAALLCEKRTEATATLPCGHCRACQLVAGNNAPDVKTVSKGDKATLGVDAIREIRQDMFLCATEFDRKIYIIEDAHTLTVQAQNALLKVLEEPPTEITVMLLCESADALLTTVRSRARLLRMQHFTPEQLRQYFVERKPSLLSPYTQKPDELTALLQAANGSIGAALDLLAPKKAAELVKERQKTQQILTALSGNDRFSQLCDCFSLFSTKREPLGKELETLLCGLRDLVLCKKSSKPSLCFFPSVTVASELAAKIPLATLFYAYDKTWEALRQIERNANIQTTLTVLKCDLAK